MMQLLTGWLLGNLIKEKGFEILHTDEESEQLKSAKESEPEGLTRSLDYYEKNVKEDLKCRI